MSRFVRPMHLKDIQQAAEIEREAFPPPWPPTNFKHDLTSNKLAYYLVACDAGPGSQEFTTEQAGSKPHEAAGDHGVGTFRAGFRRLFGLGNPQTPRGQLVLGFVGLWFMVDEAHLSNIAVRESHRRHGVGEHLLIAALDVAIERNAAFMTLEVRASNDAGQALYAKCGFEHVGVRRAYYSDNKEDAVLMTTDKIGSGEFRAGLESLRRTHAERWGTTI
jgi:ribosomal-protein-alanine N-acetyltransferase